MLEQIRTTRRSRRRETHTNVSTVDGSAGRLEAETDILVPPTGAGGLASRLRVKEKGLLLEGLLRLHTKLHVRHSDVERTTDTGPGRSKRARKLYKSHVRGLTPRDDGLLTGAYASSLLYP